MMSSFAQIQKRLLWLCLLAAVVAALQRGLIWLGVPEMLSFSLAVIPLVIVTAVETIIGQNWTQRSASALSAFFVPAALFGVGESLPKPTGEWISIPAALGLIAGAGYMVWSVFMRPTASVNE